MSGTNDTAHGGLQDDVEHDPTAIGNATIEAGEPHQTYPEYGLELVPIIHDGVKTGKHIVRQNGEYITVVSDRYKLLPNERVVEAANQVAADVGAEPFNDFSGDWFVSLDGHVFQDPDRHRVHAVYAWDEGVIGDDTVEFGFAVHNSIDSSMAFRVGLFTFRHACANLVMMGTNTIHEDFATNVEAERGVVNQSVHKHTDGLGVDVDALRARVKNALLFVGDVKQAYRSFVNEQVHPDEVLDIIDRLPQKDLPRYMEAAREEFQQAEDRAADEDWDDSRLRNAKRQTVSKHLPDDIDVWSTYNDLSGNIWHDERTSDMSKRSKMKRLHQVFPPADSVA